MGELFIFKCKECGQEFEMFHLLTEPVHHIFCPECGNTKVVRITSLEHQGALPQKKKKKGTATPKEKKE